MKVLHGFICLIKEHHDKKNKKTCFFRILPTARGHFSERHCQYEHVHNVPILTRALQG